MKNDDFITPEYKRKQIRRKKRKMTMVNKDTVRLIALVNHLERLISGGIKDFETVTEKNRDSAVFYDRTKPHPTDNDCYQVVLDMVVIDDPEYFTRVPLSYAEAPNDQEYTVYAVLCKNDEDSFLLVEFPPVDFAITITKDGWFTTD